MFYYELMGNQLIIDPMIFNNAKKVRINLF